MTTINKRIAIVPKGLKYQKRTQVRSSGGGWIPKYGMASASRETAYRHVWSRRGDRRWGIFSFRVTRDDGTVMDHTSGSILIYQSKEEAPGREIVGRTRKYDPILYPDEIIYWTLEGDTWYYFKGGDYPIEFSYNTVTQIWTVPFHIWPDLTIKKGKKFWVTYGFEDSITAMYLKPLDGGLRYYYHPEDFYKTEDYIRPKFYEMVAPYYKEISSVRTPIPDDIPYDEYCYAMHKYCYEEVGNVTLTVKSSIPYTVSYDTYGGQPTGTFWGKYRDSCGDVSCEECQILAEASEERWLWNDPPNSIVTILVDVTVTTTHGDISTNIGTNPIHAEHRITPTPYIAETEVFQIIGTYINPDPYPLTLSCSEGGETTFDLDFKIWKGGIYASVVPYSWYG